MRSLIGLYNYCGTLNLPTDAKSYADYESRNDLFFQSPFIENDFQMHLGNKDLKVEDV